MVECQICHKIVKQITYGHLKMHDIDFKEYREMFPNIPIADEEVRKKQSDKKIGKSPWNKGIKCPQFAGENNPSKRPEVREKISDSLKSSEKHKQAIQSEQWKERQKECRKDRKLTDEHKINIGIGVKTSEKYQEAINNPERSKNISNGLKNSKKFQDIIRSPEHGKKLSESLKNSEKHKKAVQSEENREKLSQYCGDKASNWQGGISFDPYCEKFNERKKEEVREQYNRKCYICGKDEKENITKINKMRKLSVHHIDNDKEQGCNNKPWKLLPLCMHCHNRRKDLINLRVDI